jgi:hypothetical protein
VEGSEGDDIDLHCEPYWQLQPEIKQHGGSGWFLWLILRGIGPQGCEREVRRLRPASDKDRAALRMNEQPVERIVTIAADVGALHGEHLSLSRK